MRDLETRLRGNSPVRKIALARLVADHLVVEEDGRLVLTEVGEVLQSFAESR